MARREKKPEPLDPPKDLAAALFLELMMQMLAFFILLTSMAVIVEEKRLAALGSLAGTFSPMRRGANVDEGEGPAMPAHPIVDEGPPPKRTAKALTEVAKFLAAEDAMTVLPLDRDTVRVRLMDYLLFDPGAVELSPAAAAFLDRLAPILSRPEVIEITIEGHTDPTPVRGRFMSNWELSAARALAVFRALAERGVPKGRMIIAGMGAAHPIPGHPEWARRVEFVLRFRPTTDEEPQRMRSLPPQGIRPSVTPPSGI